MNEIPTYDLPSDLFPFVIEYVVDGHVVHSETISEAGAMRIPSKDSLGVDHSRDVDVHIVWPDGSETWAKDELQ